MHTKLTEKQKQWILEEQYILDDEIRNLDSEEADELKDEYVGAMVEMARTAYSEVLSAAEFCAFEFYSEHDLVDAGILSINDDGSYKWEESYLIDFVTDDSFFHTSRSKTFKGVGEYDEIYLDWDKVCSESHQQQALDKAKKHWSSHEEK